MVLGASFGASGGCSKNAEIGDVAASAAASSSTGSGKPMTVKSIQFRAPIDGEIALPGDTLDVVIAAPAGITPILTVDGAKADVAWKDDPNEVGVLHAPFKVPATGATHTLRVTASEPRVAGDEISVLAPTPTASGTLDVADADAEIKLPSGARLVIPKGSVKGQVLFASYNPADIPVYAGAPKLLTPVFRVHTAADVIFGAMFIEAPVSKAVAATLHGTATNTLIETYEGEDPDVEAPPYSARADLLANADGTGTLRAELGPDAFHHTGSQGSISGIWDKAYPFEITKAQIGTYNDADMAGPSPTDFLDTSPKLQLSNAGGVSSNAHVLVTATVEWTTKAPDFASPFDDGVKLAPTSAFSSLRPTKGNASLAGQYRQHKGIDLKAAVGTTLHALAAGTASLNFNGQYSIVLPASGYTVRYMHVSNVTGFTAEVQQGKRIGKNLQKQEILAPEAGTYTLACQQIDDVAANKKLLGCDVLSVTIDDKGDPQYEALPDGCGSDTEANCLGYTSGASFTRTVQKSDAIGASGQTSRDQAGLAPHLHMEIWFGGLDGLALDPAYFFDEVALANGDMTAQSPVVRLAAQLDDPANGGALVGVDPATFQQKNPAKCPYAGGTIDAKAYDLQKIVGKNGQTTVSWDLGDCIFHQLVAIDMLSNEPVCTGKSVTVKLGNTSWWKKDSDAPWRYLDRLPPAIYKNNLLVGYEDPATLVGITEGVRDARIATIECCDAATDPNACGAPAAPVMASDFAGMKVTLAASAQYGMATITLPATITDEGTIASWKASHPQEAGNLSSGAYPANAKVYSFLDNAQSAGVAGFPASVEGKFMNRNGRSNLIVVWKDSKGKNQWVWNISGGAYTTNPLQWHEYQFIYDSTLPMGQRNRLDKYLGQGGMPVGWSMIQTWPVTGVGVTLAKKVSYTLPDAM
jgi:murein DD-endopeptidase MepM/ murein hydrolase activator NlpD